AESSAGAPPGGAPEDLGANAAPEARSPRLGRVGFWARVALAGLFGFPVVAAAFLSQTAAGQRIVLDEILNRVDAALAGELRIAGIRSQTLFTGFTLTDVALDADGGRPVLEADSVVLRYSLLSLLVASPRIGSATLHGLDLRITRDPGDGTLNVERILASRPTPDSSAAGPPRTIELGRIAVRGGMVTVLTPATAPGRTTVAGPDGAPMRRLAFEGLDLDLEETVLRPGGAVELDARLTSFASTIHVVEKPLILQAAVGDLTFGAEGLRVADGTFRLPSALLEGELGFGPERPQEPWTFAADLRTDSWGSLADLAWIDARIPEGRFRGAAEVRTGDGLLLDLNAFEVQTGASTLEASGGVDFREGMTLRQLVVTGSPLALSDLGPWIEGELPIDGFVSGQATLSGTPATLNVDGRVTLVPSGIVGTATTADISGTLLFGENAGAEGLEVRMDPVNYRTLEPFWPQAASLGEGTAFVEIDGRVDDGLLIVADLTHESDSVAVSRVFGQGRLQNEAGEWVADLRADLAPLSLALPGRLRPDVGLQGWVSGPMRFTGPLDDLSFEGELTAGGGRVTVAGSLDAANPGAAYALDLDAEGVDFATLAARVPESSVMSGHVALRGSGLVPDSLEGVATLAVRPSRIGRLHVASAASNLRATGGLLVIDSVRVEIGGAWVGGSGTLGIAPNTDGTATFAFAVDSVAAFRPMVMGDSILVRDGLSPLEEDLLRVRGIEPDTLPSELDVRMTGSARGTARVSGHVRDLGIELAFDALDVAYRHDRFDSARVELRGRGSPDMRGDWSAQVQAFGIEWASRRFQEVDFDGAMSQRRVEGTLNVVRRLGERYFATGSFALDSIVGGEVTLAEASVQIDDLSFVLDHPVSLAWDSTTVRVDSLELRRLGDDPSRVTAQGTLARGGESNFRLDMDGFHVEDATRILQREDIDVSGHVDLSLTVLGPAENPTLDALFQVEEPRYGALRLGRLNGSLAYRERSSDFRVDAWEAERNVLSAAGTLPLDLGLVGVEERARDEPMDVRVSADALDANIALAYFATLEDVAGSISAELQIGGTSREPEPSGTIRLTDGGWSISALGVRHTGLSGELELHPDRTVDVEFGTSVGGRSTVSGLVTMVPFSNPTLDLLVNLERFQAVARRDIQSTLSGAFTVRGEFRLPVAEGALRVDEGTLFVDEFARAASVVDLRDPTLFSEGFAVDTTVFVSQPILASLRNPFLDNLRVDIDLSVPRNLWLRSTEMNVEIGGELLVRYDRAENDLVMVGDLQALRGSYQVLGRTFEVDGGTVSFLGQPGVNPALGIEAVSRVRRRGGDRLEVRATVTGTLVQPLVTLSTTEQGLSQSDLVSYLLFGVPGGELSVTTAGPGGAGIEQGITSGVGTYFAGALASQIGTALAQGIGFDYLAVSQGDLLGGQDIASDFLSTAQFEVGRYFGDDVFVVFLLSCPPATGGSASGDCDTTNLFRGVRVELALSEEWFVEGFVEDRLYRGSRTLVQTGLEGQKVVGLLLFRDWGYGSQE
ncbi:MAG: hypothetical protein FJ207_14420, partial [Gemmatimonadetes bacterium]|nr:hypothetical protein [Gemmatimonadota bacterium]